MLAARTMPISLRNRGRMMSLFDCVHNSCEILSLAVQRYKLPLLSLSLSRARARARALAPLSLLLVIVVVISVSSTYFKYSRLTVQA